MIENTSNNKKDENIEKSFVNDFYNSQSISFSNTRYKAWPKIYSFYKNNVFNKTHLLNILDSGCGNGRNSLYKEIICTDNSLNLLKLCNKSTKILSNIKQTIFRFNTFDYILSIAVLHHIQYSNQRIDVLKSYYSLLKDNNNSRMIIYVWSFEKVNQQNKFISMNKYFSSLQYNERDYLCDWQNTGLFRYYYLYKLDEFKAELILSGFIIHEVGFDQESIFAIVGR